MTTRPGYIWSGTEWVAIGQEAAVSPFKYQATAPTTPATGDIWIDSSSTVNSIDSTQMLRWRKTMVGGETTLSGNDDASLPLTYTPGYEQLYINGVLQVRGVDYTATTGTTVTGLTALVANDVVEIFSAVARAVSDVYTQSQSDSRFVNKNVGGLSLVVPTSITKGASGSASVATNGAVNFTGTEYVQLNGVFSATYDMYKLQITAYNNTAQHAIVAQLSSGGTVNTASTYRYASYYNVSGGISGNNFSNTAQNGAVIGQMVYTYVNGNYWTYDISGPYLPYATAATGGGIYNDASVAVWTGASWFHSTNASFDGIRISNGSSGTMTGTIRIYGYNNGA